MRPIDEEILDLRKRKEMLVSLERLMINSDFKKVINEYYLSKHPLDLIKLKGQLPLDPTLNLSIDRQLDAIALFGLYLDNAMFELPDIDLKIEEAITRRDEITRNT
ncbi:hypothetical protein nACB1_007 [Acinetobacter phage nACB1]|nr:hypothetical protein nACB1_007 [Acinetobacter phage nACB1]